jgi:hypothetical protein
MTEEEFKATVESGREILVKYEEAGIKTPQSPTKVVRRLFKHAGLYPQPNYVVTQCMEEHAEALKKAMDQEMPEEDAKEAARLTFCASMPMLSGASNIRDFIACVTFAMSLRIIPGNEGAQLLYAAQVALTALTKRPHKRGKSSQIDTPKAEAKPAEVTT